MVQLGQWVRSHPQSSQVTSMFRRLFSNNEINCGNFLRELRTHKSLKYDAGRRYNELRNATQICLSRFDAGLTGLSQFGSTSNSMLKCGEVTALFVSRSSLFIVSHFSFFQDQVKEGMVTAFKLESQLYDWGPASLTADELPHACHQFSVNYRSVSPRMVYAYVTGLTSVS